MSRRTVGCAAVAALCLAIAAPAQVRAVGGVLAPAARPDAVVDLRTEAGLALVSGTWREAPARLEDVEHRLPGPDRRPSGPKNRTLDIAPKAGLPGFDASSWARIAPERLETRLGGGRFSLHWYRLELTLPDDIGGVPVDGATLVFEVVADDYAEVSVDGVQEVVIGETGGSVVAGWNAPNRVVVTRDAKAGRRHDIAVLVANAPLSRPPENYVWLRSATIEVTTKARAAARPSVPFAVTRLDPAIDAIVPRDARVEKIADGFSFAEGPVWHEDGHLFLSDPDTNVAWRLNEDGVAAVFRAKSGFSGLAAGRLRQPGSNGLAFDGEGRVTLCEHGNRRVTRIERNGIVTVLADSFEGRRLNSPNDLVYRSDGALFFTDPPFGLPKFHDDPARELAFCGVYAWIGGKLRIVSDDLRGPNGIALSPDERYVYVANWDEDRRVVMRYEVATDGSVKERRVFFELTNPEGPEAFDGIKTDIAGNVFVSAPGGVIVLTPEGRQLGMMRFPNLPANMAFGGADGRTLYLAARSEVYRMRLPIPGFGVRRPRGG